MEAKRFLIIPCLLFSIQSASSELQDQCPQLPPALKAIEPSYNDREAHQKFKEKHAEEFKKVELAWEKLEIGYSESREKFYSTQTYDNYDLLDEIKGLRWFN